MRMARGLRESVTSRWAHRQKAKKVDRGGERAGGVGGPRTSQQSAEPAMRVEHG